ncbi:nacht and ankyrin domain protein [Colletotrichum chrysophilum]|uniref:Nacht and ankyrin domain protein n=1 Tax=Colletotrichum chrysophilum TaxID=1836956 RepID=A0AAD9AK02_9PEZI|nr:nacht and ankyrin domain protein [Colletotrichum chrysophilum]
MGNNFVTTYAQEIERMKQRICQTKEVNRLRYRINPRPVHYEVDPTPLCPGAHFPPLPPKLPRPEYTSTANLINIDDDDEVHFYVACEQGLLDRVVTFIRENEASEAVLQFGLEQASFGNQPAVARCLLERGTLLHNNVFGRGEFDRHSKSRYPSDVTIFDKSEPAKDLVPLIQVYLDWGWHPNQAWCRALEDEGQTPLVIKGCLLNRPLVELLLKHGANPDIGENSLLANAEELPLKSSGGDAVNFAAQLGDISLVDLLLASGAEPRITKPFVSLVSSQVDTEQADFGRVPFSQRRSMAEHVLVAGIGGVNDVKWVPNRHGGVAYQVGSGYDTTAFAHACAAQDWEYAEWLLEKGADPELLDGLALRKQWWIDGLIGPNDPETVRKLVDKVKGKHLVAQ